MQRFTELYQRLDATNRTAEKTSLLENYFAVTPPADAAGALFFLFGNRVQRAVNTTRLREWLAEAAGWPLWLIEESYDAVGDLAETLALLVPPHATATRESLADLVAHRILALKGLPPDEQRLLVQQAWRELSPGQCFVWHKLILGEFRIGVARTLVVRALAAATGLSPAVMAHRLSGSWQPTAESYRGLFEPEAAADPGRPYPFYLAHPLAEPLESLGAIGDWQVEWKWDGIRAQAIRRAGHLLIWSRGEELVTERFPELACLRGALPDGTVLDGEILAWTGEQPLPFADLQTRIGRTRLTPKILAASPVVFMAYDVLEAGGADVRQRPQAERRRILEQIVAEAGNCAPLRLSALVTAPDWPELATLWRTSRERRVEGFMLKRRSASYGVGRTKGDWWKWKIEPYAIDAVLIYAQRGSGRRASLYSNYTFGLWRDGELVPMAKAYSGLTGQEIREVDAFVRANTIDKFGPVRVVKPQLVFELHFEGLQRSSRHKSGIAVRFPRMARWRRDKPAA
jgi:ATP-dependent DNA ligase